MSMNLFGEDFSDSQHKSLPDLTESQIDFLIDSYDRCGIYMDKLPYTPEIETISAEVMAEIKIPFWPQDVFRKLVELRKSKKTADVVKGIVGRTRAGSRPEWFDSQIGLINSLYGSVQKDTPLDRLPYTVEFETIYKKFLYSTGIPATRMEFWRACVAARKAGGDSPHGRVRELMA